ncbi:MAG TPA: hypothetical protein VFV83_08585 [Chthoniobacteraceae bacterium]|nr:hypothetical protein [Chthoniobacteraceae bacterium]
MKTHIQIVAALNIAAGALYLLIAAGVLFFVGMAGGIAAFQGEHAAAGVLGIIMIALCALFAVIALPSILAGWGLFTGKNWARPLALVLAILHLPNVPFGTALGIYTLWALLSPEQSRELTTAAPRPAV